MARVFRSLGLCLAFAALAGGCVISKNPLLGPGDRAVPFASGTAFEIHERDAAAAPWKKSDETVTLVAGADKAVRELKQSGKPADDYYTFHPLGPGRFLMQARFGPERYAYGVLEVRAGEGVFTAFQCKTIDQAAFRSAGGAVTADDCVLDGVADAPAYLRRLAGDPTGAQVKYVPVRKP